MCESVLKRIVLPSPHSKVAVRTSSVREPGLRRVEHRHLAVFQRIALAGIAAEVEGDAPRRASSTPREPSPRFRRDRS